jgi:tetratricopeptide (TPR) repeat protein
LLGAAVGLSLLIGAAAPSATAAQDAAPASKFLPRAETMALPQERRVFAQLLEKTADARDATAALPGLDAALAQLPEPTRFRGFVQLQRATAFDEMEDFPKAALAIEESIRLLAGYSAPLIMAASIYSYANQPAKSADYLLRAAELDPATVRTIDDYEIDGIFHRLSAARDERRAFALSERLLAIGWVGTRLGAQSSLAGRAIERRVRDGDLPGARALVPKLLVPGHSYMILSSRDYSPLWEGVERWAGPRLERQWALYLQEARARWTASKDVATVLDYSGALLAAGHYDTVIREILPIYSGKIDPREDEDLIFALTGVANALARKGRWQDADALFQRAEKIWPLKWGANAINIPGNRGRYLLFAGGPADALPYLDIALAEGHRVGVNHDAVAAMHYYRACALHQLGRAADASFSVAAALSMTSAANAALLHLCMGNDKAARQALLDGFKNPIERDSAIAFFQLSEPALPSEYSRQSRLRAHALKHDPALRAELEKYGRILPFRIDEGAPREQAEAPRSPPPQDGVDVSDRRLAPDPSS